MYIKEGEEEADGQEERAIGRVQLGFPILVGVPFLSKRGREGRSRRGRRKEGGATPS